MATDKIITHVTADVGGIRWHYSKPENTGAKMILLTIGKIAVFGNWYGEVGELYIAWSPMPKRDKVLEEQAGL